MAQKTQKFIWFTLREITSNDEMWNDAAHKILPAEQRTHALENNTNDDGAEAEIHNRIHAHAVHSFSRL